MEKGDERRSRRSIPERKEGERAWDPDAEVKQAGIQMLKESRLER